MPKSLSTLWLNSMRRIGKAQEARGKQLFLSLLPKPVKPPRLAKAAKVIKIPRLVRPVGVLKLVQAALPKVAKPPRAPAVRKPRLVQARPPALAGLPGTWSRSFFSIPQAGQLSPARRMMYWLYLPHQPVLAPGLLLEPMPLVVMVHGCDQSANDFATSTRMNELAQRKGFAVLYPQQSVESDAHRCWHWYRRPTQEGAGDVKLIAKMIASVQLKHSLDATRTYVAGLSAGAGLANILALRHPEMIAALGLHSAPVFGTTDSPMSAYSAMQHGSTTAHGSTAQSFVNGANDFPGMPVILIHGDGDTVVRPVNVQQLAHQFSIINRKTITSAEAVQRKYAARSSGKSPRHAYRTSTWYAGRKPQLVKCEIQSLGHAWSGGDGNVKYSEPRGPDASLMMWSFFTRHERAVKPAKAVFAPVVNAISG